MHLSEYMAIHSLDDDAVADGIKRSRVTVSRIRRRKVRPDWATIAMIKSYTQDQVTADDFQNIEPSDDSGEDHPESALNELGSAQ